MPLFKSFTLLRALTEPFKEGKRNHTSGQDNPSERSLVIFPLLFLAGCEIGGHATENKSGATIFQLMLFFSGTYGAAFTWLSIGPRRP